jgi:hypothetical protein
MLKLMVVGAAGIVAFTGLCLVGIAFATSPGRAGPELSARAAAIDAAEPPPAPEPRPPRVVQPVPPPVAPPPPAAVPAAPPPPAPALQDDRPLTPAEAERAEDPEGFRDRRQKGLIDSLNRRRGGGSRHTTAGEEE